MTHPRPQRPNTVVEWIKTVGIISGGMISTGIVLHFLGVTAYSAAMQPVRTELRVAADSLHASIRRERWERRASDDSVRDEVAAQHRMIMDELHDIHALLVRGRGIR